LGTLSSFPIWVIFLSAILLFQTVAFGAYSYAQLDSGSEIPSWIKNNADWWDRGLISDRDFALGLGFMVKEGIIEVENVDVDPEGEIVIDENISIPTWIQNNARWWADDAISDDDFKSGIQYMLNEDIISFKESQIPKIIQTCQSPGIFLEIQSHSELIKLREYSRNAPDNLLAVTKSIDEVSVKFAEFLDNGTLIKNATLYTCVVSQTGEIVIETSIQFENLEVQLILQEVTGDPPQGIERIIFNVS